MSFIEPASAASPLTPAPTCTDSVDGHAPTRPILDRHAVGDTGNGHAPGGSVTEEGAPGVVGPGHVDRDLVSKPEWREHLNQLGVEDLRWLAATMPVIEQAKGALMGYYGCDAAAAFAVLQRWSSNRNIKLHTVAATVVAAASRPSPTPFESLRQLLKHGEPQP